MSRLCWSETVRLVWRRGAQKASSIFTWVKGTSWRLASGGSSARALAARHVSKQGIASERMGDSFTAGRQAPTRYWGRALRLKIEPGSLGHYELVAPGPDLAP